MRYACASPLSALIPAGWSVYVNDSQTNPMEPETKDPRPMFVRQPSNLLQKPLCEVRGEATPADEKAPESALASDKMQPSIVHDNNYHLNFTAQTVDYMADIMSSTPEGRKSDSGETVTNDSDDPDINPPSTRPIPGILQILDGNLQQTSMADGFLAHVWEHLSRSEEAELNLSLRDDLRIAKLCVLEVEAGNLDPWRTAFWNYLGLSPEKFLGILAEREAFAKTLGKTLAQELENPAFLQSLSAEARPFYAFPQIKLDFSAPVLPSPKKPSQSVPSPERKIA